MKKYFLILQVLFFSFLIGSNVLALTYERTPAGTHIDTGTLINISATFGQEFEGLYGRCGGGTCNWFRLVISSFNENFCFPVNCTIDGCTINEYVNLPDREYTEVILYGSAIDPSDCVEFMASGDAITFEYDTNAVIFELSAPTTPLTASSSLILIANSALLPAIDLSANIFFNFWPYVLVIGIIAGFIAFILKKLPKRWPK